MDRRSITVAIDGPGGAGKSTVSKRVARQLGFTLVDTGAIYRAVALLASRESIAHSEESQLAERAEELDIGFQLDGDVNRVIVFGEDVTDAIRTPQISMAASSVSAHPRVRQALLRIQRRLAGEGGAVLEGRDIGTVVFPEAQVKIYLDASTEERARRRYVELKAGGAEVSLDTVREELMRRDEQDQKRACAPLRPAEDAAILDSTRLSIDEVVARIVDEVHRKVA